MKKIIVIGTGWSGSGAVFDYLAGRKSDVAAPLGDTEFRIVSDPGGLFLLYNTLKYSFSIHNADNAIKSFFLLCRDINRRLSCKESFIPINIVKEFLERICLIQYSGTPDYEVKKLKRLKKLFIVLMRNYQNRHGRRSQLFPMYYPVSDQQFFHESEKFIDAVLQYNCKELNSYSFSVINHGGTFWNPITSTQFYGNRKVLLVTRDPRDIYIEVHGRGNAYPADDVKTFCLWYKDMMKRITESEHKHEDVFHIRFEKFVNNFHEEKVRLDNFLALDSSGSSNYNPERSKKNIGKFSHSLPKEEISVIEHELMEFIKN